MDQNSNNNSNAKTSKGFKKKSDKQVYVHDKNGKLEKDEEMKKNDPDYKTPEDVEELEDVDFDRRFPDNA